MPNKFWVTEHDDVTRDRVNRQVDNFARQANKALEKGDTEEVRRITRKVIELSREYD